MKKEFGDVEKVWKDVKDCFLDPSCWMFVGKHWVLLDIKRDLVVERGGCGLGKGEAIFIHSYGKDQRNAGRGADVGK